MSKELNKQLNMTTREIIDELRSKAVDTVLFKPQMHAAADKLEELQLKCEGLLNETDRLRAGWGNAIEVIGKLEDHIADLRDNRVKPEPSRLEIALMLMQGWAANPAMESITDDPVSRPISAALEITDALIAAAKEAK